MFREQRDLLIKLINFAIIGVEVFEILAFQNLGPPGVVMVPYKIT